MILYEDVTSVHIANQVAAEHHVSVRTVYRLFDTSDQSVSAYIRSRRMERCRAEVEGRFDLSLAAVCARWGIGDPKHFSRQYRTYFGESPSDARHRLHAPAAGLVEFERTRPAWSGLEGPSRPA